MATAAEAELAIESGFTDVLVAYPPGAVQAQEEDSLRETASALADRGLDAGVLSVGVTPGMSIGSTS